MEERVESIQKFFNNGWTRFSPAVVVSWVNGARGRPLLLKSWKEDLSRLLVRLYCKPHGVRALPPLAPPMPN